MSLYQAFQGTSHALVGLFSGLPELKSDPLQANSITRLLRVPGTQVPLP
jgi:hypothetical protein